MSKLSSNSKSSFFEDDEDYSVNEDVFYETEEKTYKQILFLEDIPKTVNMNLRLLYKGDGKIYRYREEEWKERGEGYFKILYYKQENKVSFVFYQDKTFMIRSKFNIPYNTKFLLNQNEEKSENENTLIIRKFDDEDNKLIFIVYDYSDNEENPILERILLEFPNENEVEIFKTNIELAKLEIYNGSLLNLNFSDKEKVGFE